MNLPQAKQLLQAQKWELNPEDWKSMKGDQDFLKVNYKDDGSIRDALTLAGIEHNDIEMVGDKNGSYHLVSGEEAIKTLTDLGANFEGKQAYMKGRSHDTK